MESSGTEVSELSNRVVALFHIVSSDCVWSRAHVRTYWCSYIGAYLAAKQPRHEVRVSTWLGEIKFIGDVLYDRHSGCVNRCNTWQKFVLVTRAAREFLLFRNTMQAVVTS